MRTTARLALRSPQTGDNGRKRRAAARTNAGRFLGQRNAIEARGVVGVRNLNTDGPTRRMAYVDDGELDLGRGAPVTGNESIAAITKTAPHQAAIAGGLAHFAGLPRIELEGDNATVISYLQILTPHPTAEPHEVPNHGVSTGFRIHRVAANRWELERTADGWKIRRRMVRTVDGTEPPRDILRSALTAFQPAR